MVLSVNSDGEVYIKAKECETNINLVSTLNVNQEELEAFYMLIGFVNQSTQSDHPHQVLQFSSTLFSLN